MYRVLGVQRGKGSLPNIDKQCCYGVQEYSAVVG